MARVFYRKESRIPFTKVGYQHLISERDTLLAERPDAVEHLRKAREMGDLSENGYYKASRARLSFIDAQLRRVKRLITLGVIVEVTKSGRVEIGSNVTLKSGDKEYIYTIVGGFESDPAKQTISHMSPLGKELMGKREHDTVVVNAPVGKTSYTILHITYPE